MASLLRQIVAGPRARHPDTGLDLCYVTEDIIATSGPSQTYPQRAYRNPLDRLVEFLDSEHRDNWAIWEFRGEGTGYPDSAVYGRIRHYPWPDHHPPPFRLVPMIMASMRNWLNGGDLEMDGNGTKEVIGGGKPPTADGDAAAAAVALDRNKRVVVVHCKAGKGRSGTMACSYLISHCGWTPEQSLARFTERRMRPNFGAGVSIPSQLRWIRYVDRWTRHHKKYVDRAVEIVEIHTWGLRNGVKVYVEGFIEDGKRIKVLHTFSRAERHVVEGNPPEAGSVMDMVYDLTGYTAKPQEADEDSGVPLAQAANNNNNNNNNPEQGGGAAAATTNTSTTGLGPARNNSKRLKHPKTTSLVDKIVRSTSKRRGKDVKSQPSSPDASSSSTSIPKPSQPSGASTPDSAEPGGQAVVFRPQAPVRLPNCDVNVALERRSRGSLGMTMVTAVAHVWFNTFFEGNGPEQGGRPDGSGVFEIEWDKMDGIKGSSRKGTRAADRIAVVWRAVESGPDARVEDIVEPGIDSPVPQMQPANWKGGNEEDPLAGKRLGLRPEAPDSACISKASSIKSSSEGDGPGPGPAQESQDNDGDSLTGVKTSGPLGEEDLGSSALEQPSDPMKPSPTGGHGTVGQQDSLSDKTAQNGFIID